MPETNETYQPLTFDAIKIGLASPEKILEWSHGELRIVGLSETFMILELMISGAFSGLGETIPPSITSIIFTLRRIPAILLILNTFHLNGIWWVISFSGIIKGLVNFIWFYKYKKRTLKEV